MADAFQRNDISTLLQLKKLEQAALLDLLRMINLWEANIESLCRTARYILRAQIGVRKMIYYYEHENSWTEGIRQGFDPMPLSALEEMIHYKKTTRVTQGFAPGLFRMGAEFVIPILHRGQPSAYFVVADFAESETEEQSDLMFIETLANILQVAIYNRHLLQDQVRQQSLRKELELAESIQKQLLITDFSRFSEIDAYGTNISHQRIGGDYYDIIKKEKGITFTCIADVSGKGISAALLMSNLQASLRALCAQYSDPRQIVAELNRLMYPVTLSERFVTLFLLRFERKTGKLTYVNAGHNYPFLIRDGEMMTLSAGCPPLGVLPEIVPEMGAATIHAGDMLLMYTDGVVEQDNRTGEMFGTERIEAALSGSGRLNAREVVNLLLNEVDAFADGAERVDDLTLLCVKFIA